MGCKLCSQPTRTIVARRLCFCVQSSPTRRSAWLHRFTIDYGPTIPGPLPHESVKKPWAQSPRSRKSLIKRPAMRGAWDGPGLFRIPSLSRLGKALRQITSGTTDDRMVLRERTSQATRTSETKPSPSLQRNTYVYGPATTARSHWNSYRSGREKGTSAGCGGACRPIRGGNVGHSAEPPLR